MRKETLFFYIWNTIGLFVLALIVALSVEFINHGATWDGVFLAIHKHQAIAESQYIFGM